MKQGLILIIVAVTLLSVIVQFLAAPACAANTGIIRFGYLDHPGSALCRIAAAEGYFNEERLHVELVKFADSSTGLKALEKGAIDVGAFAAADTLRAIAAGKEFRIIAGGGTLLLNNPLLTELDETLHAENESRGIVVLISPSWSNEGKPVLTQLTAGLIRAYRTQWLNKSANVPAPENRGDKTIHFDPNPDYYRLERIWRLLGLQGAAMKRDYLANHVYEEIYCDALDRLLDDAADDPLLKDLSSKAVCTPNCCPVKTGKK